MTLPIVTFELHRVEDPSGISGTGIVAQGVVFANGWCVVCWQTEHNSVCVYKSPEDAVAIHGHGGKTKFKITYTHDWPDPRLLFPESEMPKERVADDIQAAVNKVVYDFKEAMGPLPVQEVKFEASKDNPDEIIVDVSIPVVGHVPSPEPDDGDDDHERVVDIDLALQIVDAEPWQKKSAPTGKPSLLLVFRTLKWLRADRAWSTKMEKIFFPTHANAGSTPKMAGTSDVIDQMCRLPISDSMRWTLTVCGAKAEELWRAYTMENRKPLADRLVAFGLDARFPIIATDAYMKSRMNKDIREICDGLRNDREYTNFGDILGGDVASVMTGLRACADALTPEQRTRMSDHIIKTFDGDRDKAWAPITKLAARLGVAKQIMTTKDLVAMGALPVAVLAKFFEGDHERLYQAIASHFVEPQRPQWMV